jgi:probable HAF family extracellular repeat protein
MRSQPASYGVTARIDQFEENIVLQVNKPMQPAQPLPARPRPPVLPVAAFVAFAGWASVAGAEPLSSPSSALPRYALTVVGDAGSIAYDVNVHDDVVGQMAVGDATHAFLYSGSTLNDLGTGGGTGAAARHINDGGQVVGSMWSGYGTSGFLYSGVSLNALQGSTNAYGINNSGTITGVFGVVGSDGFAYSHAYSYAGGVYMDAGTLIEDAGSYGYAINNAGAIAGWAEWARGANWPTNVIVYQDGVLHDLGAFEGPWAYGYSINDLGQVVGEGTIGSSGADLYPRRALLYSDGALHNLGSLVQDGYSTAYDINNLGQIVGAADAAGGLHGFLYQDGAMIDLNTLIDPGTGWTIRDAQAINDAHQIAATACRGEVCNAVRLDLVPQVPEPAGWAMSVAGIGLMAARRRRRARQR